MKLRTLMLAGAARHHAAGGNRGRGRGLDHQRRRPAAHQDLGIEGEAPRHRIGGAHRVAGAVIVADNTTQSRRGYTAYFDYIADPKNRLRTMTLPFEGGLEMTVRV